jgi:hypothetical protein
LEFTLCKEKGGSFMASRFRLLVFGLLLACAVFPFQQAHAQLNSSVQGTVSDTSSAVIPDAKVTLHNTQTGVNTVALTNPSGYYRFLYVVTGEYTVTAEKEGFATKSVAATVSVDQTIGVEITLTAATTKTTVNVTANAPAVNPEETRIQATLSKVQIEALPLQNGSDLELLRLAPGVSGIDEDRVNWAVNIANANETATANGLSADSNLFLLDGAPIMSESHTNGNTVLSSLYITPTQDMVQEVSLETMSFSVENTMGGSIVTNFVTRSGTNDWHGDVQYRYGAKSTAAKPAFTTGNGPFSRKWWMGSGGGPIRKDKTFVFASYFHQTEIESKSMLVDDPSPDFINWAQQTYPNSYDVKDLMAAFPTTFSAINGLTVTNPSLLTAGQAATTGAGGVSMTGGTCSFLTTTPQPIPCDMSMFLGTVYNQIPFVDGFQFNGRLDQYFSGGKDRIYGDYMYLSSNSNYEFWKHGYNAYTPNWARYVNVNYTHTFGPTVVNQLSVNWQRYSYDFTATPESHYETIPFFTLILGSPIGDGLDYFGTPGPTVNKEVNYMLRDDLSWVRGNHSFKFGFQGWHSQRWSDNAGYLARPVVPIFFGWPQFFDDSPFQYSLSTLSAKTGQYVPNITGAQYNNFGFYAQDNWRVTPHLTLTLGVRWDDYGNPYNYGLDSLPFAEVIRGSGSTLAEQFAGASVRSVSNALAGRMANNILPRGGFAWSPFGHDKWSIRGGVGLYEDMFWLGDMGLSLGSQPPNLLPLTFSMFNPLPPTNIMEAANLYGTNTVAPPYGYTYSHPTVTPLGFDSRGGVIQSYGANGIPILFPSNLTGNDPHLGPKRNALWSVGFEREIGHDMVVGATYSGSYSWDQWYQGDFNTFPGDLIVNNGVEMRLTPEWGSITYLRNGMSANYNALMLLLRRKRGPFSWQASYTWSRCLDDDIEDSISGNMMNPYNPNSLYGPCNTDIPQHFSLGAVYQTPEFGKEGFTKILGHQVLGDWELSTISMAESGPPFSVYTNAAWNPTATSPAAGGDFLANGVDYSFPDVAPGTQKKGFTKAQYLNGMFSPSNFTLPVNYGVEPEYGTQGRNSFRGPGYLSIDASLRKRFVLPWFRDKKSALVVSAEATNFFNRLNLAPPNSSNSYGETTVTCNDMTDPFFSRITAAYQNRIVQLVARFEF